MKVLTAMTDVAFARSLHERFEKRFGAELEVQNAEGALYALTMLERDTPDLIISGKELGDMSGLDFHEIVRDDSSAKDVAFILLDPDATQLASSNSDKFLEERAHPADILKAAFELLIANGHIKEDRQVPRNRLRSNLQRNDAKVSGTLEVFTLFDLVVSLTQKENSGRLYVLLGDTESMMFFERGRFVHAEFEGVVGEDAVVRIFAEADRYKDAEFYFEPSEVPLPQGSTTIHSTVQELLLKVAVELDHEREAALHPVKR